MNSFYPIVIAELKSLGFYFDRQGKGSHEIWTNGSKSFPVPVSIKSRHTANGIMKDAGSTKKV
jgi:predicted RNA binding protein YcfA (HicA-like mRNA interferase family)